jgi:hypothetical protein
LCKISLFYFYLFYRINAFLPHLLRLTFKYTSIMLSYMLSRSDVRVSSNTNQNNINAFPQMIYDSYELLSTSKKSNIDNIAGFKKEITKINITHDFRLPNLIIGLYILYYFIIFKIIFIFIWYIFCIYIIKR